VSFCGGLVRGEGAREGREGGRVTRGFRERGRGGRGGGGTYVCPLWNLAWGGQRGLKTWVGDQSA